MKEIENYSFISLSLIIAFSSKLKELTRCTRTDLESRTMPYQRTRSQNNRHVNLLQDVRALKQDRF